MIRKIALALTPGITVLTATACGTAAETATPGPAQPPMTANAVAIARQAGATLSTGDGSYAVSTGGAAFPGGEQVSVYTYGTPGGYSAELTRLATVYPMDFGTYIMLPRKLAVIVINGTILPSGKQAWGGPSPQQIARLTGGTVASH